MNNSTLFDMIFKMTNVIEKKDGLGLNMTRLDRIYIENYKSAIINCPKIIFALQ